jgi:colanic acid/amylovoran biosynthesis glycosyltransferase
MPVRLARRARTGHASLLAIASYVEGLSSVADVDVIHCHFGPIGLAVADALDVLDAQTPLITTFHGYDLTQHLRRHPARDYGRLFARGARFLPVSDYFRRKLLQIGAPSDQTTVHYLGVDTERFRPSERPGPHDGPIRVLMVGRFVEKKGFLYGLRAVAQARTHGCRIKTTVIGDGPLRAELEAEIKNLGISDSTSLRGSLGHDGVAREMAENDVLLAPSVEAADGDMEGIPIVILEAMAMGLPVVSSRHSGIPEAVLDGETGLLAEERDSSTLAQHLVRLGSSHAERTRFGTAGRAHVLRQHNRTSETRELESIYERVMAAVAASTSEPRSPDRY